MSVKQVIVLRKDLGMRKGKMAAQAAHASLGVFTKPGVGSIDDAEPGWDSGPLASRFLSVKLTPEMEEWLQSSFRKIVVGCESEEELLELARKAEELRLPFCLIKDNGTTEFHGVPTYTALAVGPARDEAVDLVTGGLALL